MVAVITAAFPWKSAMIGISSTKSLFPWAARTRYLTWPTSTNIANLFSWSAARKRDEMLELYEGKPSRTVLRRESGSNPTDLAGCTGGHASFLEGRSDDCRNHMSDKDWSDLGAEADEPHHAVNSRTDVDILVNIQTERELSQFKVWISSRCRGLGDDPVPRREDNRITDMMNPRPVKDVPFLHRDVADPGADSIGNVPSGPTVLRVRQAAMVYLEPIHTVKV